MVAVKLRHTLHQVNNGIVRQLQNFRRHRVSTKFENVGWLRKNVYLLIEDYRSSCPARVTHVIVLTTILVSILAFTLESLPELWHVVAPEFWYNVEVVCAVIFTVEYGLRFWSCTAAGTKRWKFFWTPLNFLDLCALAPFYIDLLVEAIDSLGGGLSQPLRVLRIFRLIRIIRVFKVTRNSGLEVMYVAVANCRHALVILAFSFMLGVLTFSSLIFYVEKMDCASLDDVPLSERDGMHKHMQESTCENIPRVGWSRFGLCCDANGAALDFPSIPHAFWWSVVTMTTVGYGDKLPRTRQGKIVATIVILTGILFIALPTAIVGRKFNDIYTALHEEAATSTKPFNRATPYRRLRHKTGLGPEATFVDPSKHETFTAAPSTRLVEKRHVDKQVDVLLKKFRRNMTTYQRLAEDDCRLQKGLIARSMESLRYMEKALKKPE